MRTPRLLRELRPWPVAAVLLVAGTLVSAGTVSGASRSQLRAAEAWHTAFDARPQVDLGGRMIVVLAAPSLADRFAEAKSPPSPDSQRRIVRAIDAFQRRLLAALGRQGVKIRRERVYSLTFDGFSAVLSARAVAALERAPGVLGVYPVRAVYPASLSARVLERPELGAGSGHRLDLAVSGYDGRGVTVALLDTGLDRRQPALAGRLLGGVDLVGRRHRGRSPAERALLEAHGTRMAGIVAGTDEPDGIEGIAPAASILPIRVLGPVRGPAGELEVAGRSDVLLSGLERAVDPDGNGDVTDAARVALAALVEPYAAFADGPAARAVAGARELGTLVVAAAGNDGPATGGFGTIGAPGGAPDALTVGAADLRRDLATAAVRVAISGRTIYDGTSRLLGAAAPGSELTLTGSEVATLPADGTPVLPRVEEATADDARAVLVYGSALPSGSLDLGEGAAVPVVTIPLATGRRVAEARPENVSVTISPPTPTANPGLARVAPFSSRGPAFDGHAKPELVAPGVAIATVDAGGGTGNAARFATVTGSSAAAAAVAGSAALVAQARPRLSAAALEAVLVGSASPLEPGGEAAPVAGAGAGLVDPAAAAGATVGVTPSALSLGRVTGARWHAEQTVTIRNLSASTQHLSLDFVQAAGDALPLHFRARPAAFVLKAGESRRVRLRVGTSGRPPRPVSAGGELLVRDGAGGAARVPWTVSYAGRDTHPLVAISRLSHRTFAPSTSPASVVTFRAGRVSSGPRGIGIEPVGLLEAELETAGGKRLGVLARFRDLLPGRYTLGLTGRGPDGEKLAPGRYVLRLKATAADAREGDSAAASAASTAFTIGSP